jgi:hypothetical protein
MSYISSLCSLDPARWYVVFGSNNYQPTDTACLPALPPCLALPALPCLPASPSALFGSQCANVPTTPSNDEHMKT